MTTGPDLAIRRLVAADAPGCDEIVRSLPYHFGDPGRRGHRLPGAKLEHGRVGLRAEGGVGDAGRRVEHGQPVAAGAAADVVEDPAGVQAAAVGAAQQGVDVVVGPRVEPGDVQPGGRVQGDQVGAGDRAAALADRGEAAADVDDAADLDDGAPRPRRTGGWSPGSGTARHRPATTAARRAAGWRGRRAGRGRRYALMAPLQTQARQTGPRRGKAQRCLDVGGCAI